MEFLKLVGAFFKINLRNNLSLKASFLFQIIFMIISNLLYFAIWYILFDQVKEVNLWTIQDIAALNVISCASWGIFQICLGGLRNLSKMISDGDLDIFLLSPPHPLFMIMSSKSYPSGWGNLATSIIMLPFCSDIFFPLLTVTVLCSVTVFGMIFVIIHSIAFWVKNIDSFAKQWTDFVYILSVYPQNSYPGFVKIILFTLLPAGFISFLPVEILRNFTWWKLFSLILGAIVFILLGFTIFKAGLKRYESGNRIG